MNSLSLFTEFPRFKWWLTSRFLTNTGKQMVSLIVYWQVYDLTKDPLSLGIIGLAEYVPFFAMALWAGHLADLHERRRLLMLSQVGQFFCAGFLLFATVTGRINVWVVYGMVGLASVFSSIEIAAAGSYIQTMIPKQIFPKAAAWNLTLFNTATIGGPIFAGWVIAQFSIDAAYLLATLFFLFSAAATLKLPQAKIVSDESHGQSTWTRMKAGFQFILKERLILGTMTLDLVAVLFGGAVALFPIFAVFLGVGPTGLGALQAAPAVGSLLVSATQTRWSFFKTDWNSLCHTVTIFGLCMIGFALSKSFVLSLILLALSGVADGVSVIIRSSILQARTPDHLRGRVVAVGSVFIRSSNELGAFESGLVAKFIGAVPSVVLGGVVTLLSVFGLRRVFDDLS